MDNPEETHPMFLDAPHLDGIAFHMLGILHENVGPEKLPTSWSDFSEGQVSRAKRAAKFVYDAGAEGRTYSIGHPRNKPPGKYKVGDVVRLIGQPVSMTVISVDIYWSTTDVGEWRINYRVMWFGQNEFKNRDFSEKLLEPAN